MGYPAVEPDLDLFKAPFAQILNSDHPLLILAEKIDWKRFDLALATASARTSKHRHCPLV